MWLIDLMDCCLFGTFGLRVWSFHKTAIENPAKVYEKLAKESLLNRIAGPFKTPPF
jgi:hypothetical protein